MKRKKLIWILEDDKSIQFTYRMMLELRYHLKMFCSLKEYTDEILKDKESPDLLIADLRLPGESFFSFLAESPLAESVTYPFLIVSSVDDKDVLRACFEEGALDYITKPFNKQELLVKIERFLSASFVSKTQIGDKEIDIKNLELDTMSLNLTCARGSVRLTPKEMQILSVLNSSYDLPVLKQSIIKHVWNDICVEPKALDVHLFNLRRKIKGLGFSIYFEPPNSFRLCRAK